MATKQPLDAKRPRLENSDSEEDECSLPNPHLGSLETDYLYHIGYSRHEAKEHFSDVKFVVMGGSSNRMGTFAEFVAREINHPNPVKEELSITRTDRFVFYKIGPVLSISHGMGVPSITILVHELLKLLTYAGAKDAVFIRIGTSGGLGVPPGTVVIANRAFNGLLKEEHETVILGERKVRPSTLDQGLAQKIHSCQDDSSFRTALGGTMCTNDFYEGQARMDGAICEFSEDAKMEYLRKVKESGVTNIEMECTAMASLCLKTGFKCAIVCVTLVDRLSKDQVKISDETYKAFQKRPQELVTKFIKSQLS